MIVLLLLGERGPTFGSSISSSWVSMRPNPNEKAFIQVPSFHYACAAFIHLHESKVESKNRILLLLFLPPLLLYFLIVKEKFPSYVVIQRTFAYCPKIENFFFSFEFIMLLLPQCQTKRYSSFHIKISWKWESNSRHCWHRWIIDSLWLFMVKLYGG